MAASPFDDHPLDGDDAAPPPSLFSLKASKAYTPLLKPSLIVLAGSFVVTFLSAVASANAPFNSPFALIATGVNRIAAMVMLASFCAILLAYRIPNLRTLRSRSGERRWFESSFVNLVVLNLVGVVFSWCMLFLFAELVGAWAAAIVYGALFVFAGLLATMIYLHKGVLRVYAIGALTVIVLTLNSGATSLLTFGFTGRGGLQVWLLGIPITLISLTGLVCAGYLQVFQAFARKQKEE